MASTTQGHVVRSLLALAESDAAPSDPRFSEQLLAVAGAAAVEDFLNSELRQIAADGCYFNDAWQHNRVVIGELLGATLAVSSLQRAPRFAYALDAPTWVTVPVSTAPEARLLIEEYLVSDPGAGSQVVLASRRPVHVGEVGVLEAGKIYRLVASRPIAILSFSLPPTNNTLTKVDCEVMCVIEAEHIQNDVMALCSAAEILGAFGGNDSIEPLASLLDHSSHHVRWASATALVQISPTAALPLIKRLESDAHANVRAAAKATCSRLAGLMETKEEIA